MKSKNVFWMSPIYIVLTAVICLLGGVGISLSALFIDNSSYLLFFVPLFCFSFLNFSWFYLEAPFIYKRVTLTDEGIKCGKNFVKYEDIETIKIYCCYHRASKTGSLIKVPFESQIIEVFVGEIICINCDFTGFGFKGSKGRIYIPKNEKTDAILRKHIEKYSSVSDGFCDKPDKIKFTWTLNEKVLFMIDFN